MALLAKMYDAVSAMTRLTVGRFIGQLQWISSDSSRSGTLLRTLLCGRQKERTVESLGPALI